MDFLLAMSIFSSAADLSRENARAQEWMRRGAAGDDGQKTADAAEQGKPPPQQQQPNEARGAATREAREKRVQGIPHFALEFDGINGFETIISH